MKYIGPFLRANALSKNNIKNQLFYLSRESLKYLVLESKCGVTTSINDLKIKQLSKNDINTINSFSPLLSIYKKANAKLMEDNDSHCLNEEKFKKEINIFGTSLMTLSILEMSKYYSNFKNVAKDKYALGILYQKLARQQLEFYASYLRNEEGVFVDKKDISDSVLSELKFEEKTDKFNYSNQGFLMCAYYRYSMISKDKYSDDYKNFSLDILNMFINYREELYHISTEELLKLVLALNIFYSYTNKQEVKSLLLDLSEFLVEKYRHSPFSEEDTKLEYECTLYINSMLLYKNTQILKFKDISDSIYERLSSLYNPELGIFIKDSDKKEIEYSSLDISLYIICSLIHSDYNNQKSVNEIIIDVFKKQLIHSGIVLSWPNAPSLDDIERYKNYSLKAEDLLDEENFRMNVMPSPDSVMLAPVFVKSITFNTKKQVFSSNKSSFDIPRNMYIFFMIIYLFKNEFNVHIEREYIEEPAFVEEE